MNHLTEGDRKRVTERKNQNEKRDQRRADKIELGTKLVNVLQSLVSKTSNETEGKEMKGKKKNENVTGKGKKVKYIPVTDSESDE